ncbi:MAG: hypothetical protein PWR10_602 [Halanaerobiales bacterium]|nr:hypothetical protein [Halanaerobiales bacterium]
MTQPINPHTNIPMSLKVERMQQVKYVQSEQQQGQLAQKMETENRIKQQRVNKNNEPDGARIREENGERRQKDSQKKKEKKEGSGEGKKGKSHRKGEIFDIKV